MKRQITIRACCLSLLMLCLITLSTVSVSSQGQLSTPSPGQPEVKEGDKEQQNPNLLKELEGRIKGWVQKHPLLAIIWGIAAPILIWIFKDLIKKMVTDGLKPLLAKLITRLFILFGRYRALLKRYQRNLQRRLRKGGLTRQLIGEGVDLERNYIPIQISKEEYRNPETVHSFEPTDEVQKEDRIRTGMEASRRERTEVNKVLSNEKVYGNRIAIIGDPGSGKTTLMQYLAYQCAKSEGVRSIPVLVTLTDYVGSEARDFSSYLPAVFENNAFPKAQDYLKTQLKAGKLLILLDGFDEVEIDKREGLRNQIEAFANNEEYLHNKFVVTSRPIREAVFDNFRHLQVMPLLPEQRRMFLESKIDDSPDSQFNSRKCAKLVDAIEGHDRIRKLASNPLLLTFLYHVYKYNLELPRRRVELYRLSVNLMLDWDIETGRPTHIMVEDRDAKREILKNVAYYYHTNQTSVLPRDELIKQVDKHLPDSLKKDFTAEALIDEIENSSGILRHSAAEAYQFIHLTFQEYLTADYINDNRDKEVEKLMESLCDSRWREVALLLAGIMGNATPLVSRILGYREKMVEESEHLSYLFIALICLYEAQVDDAVRDQVFEALSKVPHDQAAEVIESSFGSREEMSSELKTLLVNILNSPNESVHSWGVGFLSQYIIRVSYDQAADIIESSFGPLEEMDGEPETLLVDLLNSPDAPVHNWVVGFLSQYQSRITITGRDGAPMVFIPAGEFQMGDAFDEGSADERPVHPVYLDAFWIDKYEVTNAKYAGFLNEYGRITDDGGHELLRVDSEYCLIEKAGGTYRPKSGYEDHPVVEVSWYGAAAYARFYGKLLPTEAEWEKAARGGLVGKRYPLGNGLTHDDANYYGTAGRGERDGTSPVGSFPPNGYGLCDMAGNVWEWCADWYDSEYHSRSLDRNPPGSDSGSYRVLRGGSWDHNPSPLILRVSFRSYYNPEGAGNNVGFRCAGLNVTP